MGSWKLLFSDFHAMSGSGTSGNTEEKERPLFSDSYYAQGIVCMDYR